MPPPPTTQERANFDYVALTSLVLVAWELLVHFFHDVSYLRMRGWYRRPVIWAYFLQRYVAFAVVLAETNIRIGKPSNCYAAGLVALIGGGIFVLPSISLIFLYRVLAIWNKKRAVKYSLVALWIIVLGASFTAPFSQSAANLPRGGCTITRSEIYTPASFIANAIYDSVVFLLTVIKLGANRRQYRTFRSPLQTLLLHDGILYFTVSVVVGIVDIIFLEAFKSPTLASTVIPFHVALASIMTTRLMNNVFRVIVDKPGSLHFSPNTDVTGRTVPPTSPTAAVSSKTLSQRGRTAYFLPTFTVGSGVGTDWFNDIGSESRGDPDSSEMAVESGKGLVGSHTYAVPMQMPSPMSPASRPQILGARVETDQGVTND